MRFVNKTVISGIDAQNQTSIIIDTNQMISSSWQVFFGDTNAAGTFKLWASNDPLTPQRNTQDFTPTDWVLVPTQSATITSGGSALLTIAQMSYRWMKAVWTNTAAGVQTIAVKADVAGSLNNKYFFLTGGNNTLYYVWFNVNSAGTDPALAGMTGIEVDIATGATASTVGSTMATAIAAIGSSAIFGTSGTTTVTVTNLATGPFAPASDHNTTFTFAVTAGGTTTVTAEMFGFSV